MEYEIELKLLTNEQAGEIIEKKLLPLLNVTVSQETLVLTNHYFDTSDRVLRQHDIGLRIRGSNQKFEQTLKTAGKSIGGLHQRPEYNVYLDDEKQNVKVPDLKLFPFAAWPETIDVDDLQANIKTLFTTHFARKVYLLEFLDGEIVELVWDLGEVTSGDKSVPICEIELELKKGSTTTLFNLAKRIVNLLPTSIGTDSKAALGYKLLDDLPVKELKQYHQSTPENMQNEAKDFASLMTIQLHDFQMLSATIRRQYSEVLATNIKQVLNGLVNNLAKFIQHFPSPSLDLIQTELHILIKDWSTALQKDDTHSANRVLIRPQTTQLQLDIVQCLVEKPWSFNV